MSFQFLNQQITFYLFITSWCQIKFYPLVDIFCTSYHLSANKYLNIGTRNSNLDLSRKGGRSLKLRSILILSVSFFFLCGHRYFQFQSRPQGTKHILDFDHRRCFHSHACVDSQPNCCSAVSCRKNLERR